MSESAGIRYIDLALQGGGSHGAYTWGVLDRLLADERLGIGGISGTSAGAMNAVVLATGQATGGREGAREALRAFWEDIGGNRGSANPFASSPFAALFEPWRHAHNPLTAVYEAFSRLLSPYQLNPLDINPLREVVRRHVDFGALREMEDLKLFVAATNVRTGHHRLFRNAELDVEAIMASACLPVIFRAVEIDGEPYWDGGYTSNPALLPLIAESQPVDLILVQLNPVVHQGIPQQAHEIIDRMNEISFNSSLNQELRTLSLIKELLQQESASGNDYREPLFQRIDAVNIHRIAARTELASFGASSKMNARWAFLELLHDLGYQAAGDWLAEHFDDLGQRSTLDLGGHALDPTEEP